MKIKLGDPIHEAYMRQQLPFPQYLTSCDYHPITKELFSAQQLVSANVEHLLSQRGLHYMAKYSIPRRGGKPYEISVISGDYFYCRDDAPYEILGPVFGDMDAHDVVKHSYDYGVMPFRDDAFLMMYLAKVITHADLENQIHPQPSN